MAADSFFGALAQGLGDYAKYRAAGSPAGRAVMDGFQHHKAQQQFDNSMNQGMERNPQSQDDALTPPDISGSVRPPVPSPIAAQSATMEPMAAGKVVTSPTTAILGENGPEAVVPLTDQPGNRVSTKMLGAGGIRSRYRHPQGPVSVGRNRPISAALPVRPNPALR